MSNQLLSAIERTDNLIRLKKVEQEFKSFLDQHLNHENAILSYPVLNQLLFLYDLHFFDKYLLKNTVISLDVSRRMTRAAGLTRHHKHTNEFDLVFSVPLLLHTFNENKGKAFEVNGLACNNPMQALMRVMEHELVHILEFVLKGNSSCSKSDFRVIAYRLFAHTQTRHAISNDIVEIKKSDFKIGQKVNFEFEGKSYTGIINRITKRATVLIESSKGGFLMENGKRYLKYYVPLQLLKKV